MVSDALRLLAGFSCNDLRASIKVPATISPNYTEVPWDVAVKEICTQNALACWTKDGALYAVDRRMPIKIALDYMYSMLSPE